MNDLSSLIADQWQPIDSAPKGANGLAWMLLAYGPADEQTVGVGMRFHDQFFAASTFYKGGPAGERQYIFRENEVHPSHWMPLPAPPRALDQKGSSNG
jgi:hypothetical protein